LKVPGYSPARIFRAPDYSDPATDQTQNDFRSTIYWNPKIITSPEAGKATVSFYAADLEGSYRIIVEGISDHGDPIRCEFMTRVEK
jgi:hypothetical protein